MSRDKKYGNDNYWCFIPEGWNGKEVAIWKNNENGGEIIARIVNKYDAKKIVDALLKYADTEDATQLDKKELAFLEFVCSNCIEPYATMAANAILWNDKVACKDLIDKFPTIYS